MMDDIKKKKEEYKNKAVFQKDEVLYPGKDNLDKQGGIKDRV